MPTEDEKISALGLEIFARPASERKGTILSKKKGLDGTSLATKAFSDSVCISNGRSWR